jgi:hypothetical protein
MRPTTKAAFTLAAAVSMAAALAGVAAGPAPATTSMGHIINALSLARTYLPINHARMLPLGSCRPPGDR